MTDLNLAELRLKWASMSDSQEWAVLDLVDRMGEALEAEEAVAQHEADCHACDPSDGVWCAEGKRLILVSEKRRVKALADYRRAKEE